MIIAQSNNIEDSHNINTMIIDKNITHSKDTYDINVFKGADGIDVIDH